LKKGLLKYRLAYIITLFTFCVVNVLFIAVSPRLVSEKPQYFTRNESVSKYEHVLEMYSDDSTPVSSGVKVEIVTIACPVSFDSGGDHTNNMNLLDKLYSKKRCSSYYRSNLILSKSRHLSPLITKLQI
jgi:hypothetical protein